VIYIYNIYIYIFLGAGRYQCVDAPTVFGAGDVLGPPGLASTGVEQVRKRYMSFCHFIATENDQFTKTGSGQA
jgi:hypothetical protein